MTTFPQHTFDGARNNGIWPTSEKTAVRLPYHAGLCCKRGIAILSALRVCESWSIANPGNKTVFFSRRNSSDFSTIGCFETVFFRFSKKHELVGRLQSLDVLLQEPQEEQRADDGAQHLGLRVRMCIRLCCRHGHLLVSVVCKGMEFCGRKRVVHRTDSEYAISALNTAVCQTRIEETILENSSKCSSSSMGAREVANRLAEGQIRTTRARLEKVQKVDIDITDPIGSTRVLVAQLVQSQARRSRSLPRHQRMAIRRRSRSRPVATEVRGSLESWNMARQSGEIG